MFGGGREPSEEEEELGTDEEDYWTGGRNPKVLENVFQGGIAGSDFIWVGYIGAEPLHGTSTGNFPAQCRQENNWEATEETGGGGAGSTQRWRHKWRGWVLWRWELMS